MPRAWGTRRGVSQGCVACDAPLTAARTGRANRSSPTEWQDKANVSWSLWTRHLARLLHDPLLACDLHFSIQAAARGDD